jgi:hypothetical protein
VALRGGVVGVEHHPALVDVLAEHGAGAGHAVVGCGGQHHRVRLDDPVGGGVVEPAGQLLVPRVGEIAHVQLVPAVVDTHLGELGFHGTSTSSCDPTLEVPDWDS